MQFIQAHTDRCRLSSNRSIAVVASSPWDAARRIGSPAVRARAARAGFFFSRAVEILPHRASEYASARDGAVANVADDFRIYYDRRFRRGAESCSDWACRETMIGCANAKPHDQVILGGEIFYFGDLIGQGEGVLNPARAALINQARGGAVGNIAGGFPFDLFGRTDHPEHFAANRARMIEEGAVYQRRVSLAMVGALDLGYGDQLGRAGAAAGHGEHQYRLAFGQHLSFTLLGALDIRAKPFDSRRWRPACGSLRSLRIAAKP